MIGYFELTDALRKGRIIRQDGRKHYRFSFGPFQWERTTIFQAYLTEGTPLFGKYRALSEEEAQSLLMQQGREAARMLKKAEEIAGEAHSHQKTKAGSPYLNHIREVADSLADWEEKTAAWLHEVCSHASWTVEKLAAAGFNPQICRSVALLTRAEGDSFGVHLAKLRMDRIARRVKIADLGWFIESADEKQLSAEESRVIEKCREARKYLFGDIPTYADTLDVGALHGPEAGLVPAEQVYQKAYSRALGGRKIPHGISNPVLRRWGERLYLAFFVYTYTRQQLQQGLIGRPVSWMLTDLASGEPVAEIPCSREDFSGAPAKSVFSTENPGGRKDGEFFRENYALLDAVRSAYLEDGQVDAERYEEYLRRILQAVPPSYHRFYRELSNP